MKIDEFKMGYCYRRNSLLSLSESVQDELEPSEDTIDWLILTNNYLIANENLCRFLDVHNISVSNK